jgi:hypothetical protein
MRAGLPVVECTMFYVLIFSLAAVLLIIAAATTTPVNGQQTHGARGTHPDASGRRNRKAKRAQSQHDRRKRH